MAAKSGPRGVRFGWGILIFCMTGAPRLGVIVTVVSISKIIGEAKIFNIGMSIH